MIASRRRKNPALCSFKATWQETDQLVLSLVLSQQSKSKVNLTKGAEEEERR